MNSFSALSPTQRAVLQSVTQFRQLTTSQIRRLHYSGTPDGQRVRSCRHLARLTKLGLLKRMWGAYSGSVEYVYQLPTTKARTPEPHTLDIAEVYVRLVDSVNYDQPGLLNAGDARSDTGVQSGLTFLTEPWCHERVGHVQLKPDAYTEVGGVSYWLEIDTGVEWESQLTAKMRRYIQAIDSGHWPDGRAFPLVLWVVPDAARKAYLDNIINKLGEKELFQTILFSEVSDRLCYANV